jgi:putative DNA primase/helicase
MNAAAIAAALGDARRDGRAWRCRCPLHGGRSLGLADGDNGRVLVTCWGGCDRRDVLTELRRRGLLDARADYAPHIISPPRPHDDASRTARALKIWRGASLGAETIASRYLASRGIELEHWPASLRFHPRCPRPRDGAGNLVSPLPAMVALVEHVERGPMAVHCTYLRPDGSDKADLPKHEQRACFGPVSGGAVRLGMPRSGDWSAVSEGIETGLSIAAACSMPTWAALSAGGIKNLTLPPEATHVVICADHDASGTGERDAHDAAARLIAEGRCVRIAMPPAPGADFNDVLMGRVAAEINEARHVAA